MVLGPRFLTFLVATAILVITPGAATAVVIRNAMSGGRRAALTTAVGIGLGNLTWAVGSCAGLSVVIGGSRLALESLKWIGAGYLGFLGAQSVWGALHSGKTDLVGSSGGHGMSSTAVSPVGRSYLAEGGLTNLLNPAAAVFYTSFIPQFIAPNQPFARRFLMLSGIHMAMALCCHSVYALAIGGWTETMTKPKVRRVMQVVSGAALVALAANLALSQ